MCLYSLRQLIPGSPEVSAATRGYIERCRDDEERCARGWTGGRELFYGEKLFRLFHTLLQSLILLYVTFSSECLFILLAEILKNCLVNTLLATDVPFDLVYHHYNI